MKNLGLEIYNLRTQILAPKMTQILPKKSAFCKLQVLIELIFRFTFQFSIFILKQSSKMCLIFSYFSTVFEKLANISQQELSLKHILKECLISKDLQIIRKKQTPFWSALIRVAPLKILKRYCSAFGTWSSPSTTRYKHLTKQGCNFTSVIDLIFPPEFDILLSLLLLLFDFSPA